MAQSLIKATAHEDLKRLLGKAQALDELESTIPAFIERLLPQSYPAFVHVLRVRVGVFCVCVWGGGGGGGGGGGSD
jgi:hypothetical protein